MPNREFTFMVYYKHDEQLMVTVGKAENTGEAIENLPANDPDRINLDMAHEVTRKLRLDDKILLNPPQPLVKGTDEYPCLRIDSQAISTALNEFGVWRNVHMQNGTQGSKQKSYAVVKINQGAQLCFAVNREHQLLENLQAGLMQSWNSKTKFQIHVKIERKKRTQKNWLKVDIKEKDISELKQEIEKRLKTMEIFRSKRLQLTKNLHKIAKKSSMIEHVVSTIERNIIKASEKEGPHIVAKKIPIVSIGVGLYYGICRFKDGDYTGAFAEMASGVLADIPGLGTAASTAIDVTLLLNDISTTHKDTQEHKKLTEAEIHALEEENDSLRYDLSSFELNGAVKQSKMFGEGSAESYFDESESAFTDDISKIHIRSSDFINGIQIEYKIGGKKDYHGGSCGTLKTMILDQSEKITKVEVSMECGNVASLTFFTDFSREESFGIVRNNIETYELADGAYLAAIKGHNRFKPGGVSQIPENRDVIPAIGFTAKC